MFTKLIGTLFFTLGIAVGVAAHDGIAISQASACPPASATQIICEPQSNGTWLCMKPGGGQSFYKATPA